MSDTTDVSAIMDLAMDLAMDIFLESVYTIFSIVKILNHYIMLLFTHLYHFFLVTMSPVSQSL